MALALFVAAVLFFAIWTSDYYRADQAAIQALQSDDTVAVSETDYGWFFDGPGDDTAMVFYPGAKVEETAYAPLLHELAEEGIDVCLVKMPLHLAVLNGNAAEEVMKEYNYSVWYLAGHSMGGAMAARYAAKHGNEAEGIIMLAAYPTESLAKDMKALVLVGSEDEVIQEEKLAEGRQYASDDYEEIVIAGGNHAQFGNYGEQKGDGKATVSGEEQRERAVEEILEMVRR